MRARKVMEAVHGRIPRSINRRSISRRSARRRSISRSNTVLKDIPIKEIPIRGIRMSVAKIRKKRRRDHDTSANDHCSTLPAALAKMLKSSSGMVKSSSLVAKASLDETQLKSFTLQGLPWKLV